MQDAATLWPSCGPKPARSSELLAANGGDLWPKLIDAISVTPGYELALGAALGEDLQASGDSGAPMFWRDLPPTYESGALPGEAIPLSRFVQGPPELDRRLARIGIVADHATGHGLQPYLAPGQILVGRDGAVWRWDGFTVKAGAPTAAATRLAQRNRLNDLRGEVEIAEAEWAEIERQYNRHPRQPAAEPGTRPGRPPGHARGRAGAEREASDPCPPAAAGQCRRQPAAGVAGADRPPQSGIRRSAGAR